MGRALLYRSGTRLHGEHPPHTAVIIWETVKKDFFSPLCSPPPCYVDVALLSFAFDLYRSCELRGRIMPLKSGIYYLPHIIEQKHAWRVKSVYEKIRIHRKTGARSWSLACRCCCCCSRAEAREIKQHGVIAATTTSTIICVGGRQPPSHALQCTCTTRAAAALVRARGELGIPTIVACRPVSHLCR